MAKRGRKNSYDQKIQPYLAQVREWSKQGKTERAIAKQLGVAYSTFNKYKAEKTELSEALKAGRKGCVEAIENAMYRRAIGFQYVEEKVTESEKDGKKTERITKTALPDVTAGIYLLKHWGREEGYTNDPMSMELKKKELELKEKIAEENNW